MRLPESVRATTEPLRRAWDRRAPREQVLLAVAAFALSVLAIYVLLWEPLQQRQTSLRAALDAAHEELAWLEAQAPALRAARDSGAPTGTRRPTTRDARSLLAALDADLRSAGFAESIRQVAPDGERLRVRLEQVPYSTFVAWIDRATERLGLDVESLDMRRGERPGRVDSELLLGLPGRDDETAARAR